MMVATPHNCNLNFMRSPAQDSPDRCLEISGDCEDSFTKEFYEDSTTNESGSQESASSILNV